MISHESKVPKLRIVLIALSFMGALFLRLPVSAQLTPQDEATAGARKQVDMVRAARRADGLHKAALLNNGFYAASRSGVPWHRADSLEGLVHQSSNIFVGKVQDSNSELIDQGRDIRTHFTMSVEQSIKGNPPRIVDLVLPGGRITFEDGTIAIVNVTKQPALLKDHRYLLFVDGSGDGKTLVPVFADQSVFELKLDGHSVHPHAASATDPLQASAQLTQEQFLVKVRDLVKEEKP